MTAEIPTTPCLIDPYKDCPGTCQAHAMAIDVINEIARRIQMSPEEVIKRLRRETDPRKRAKKIAQNYAQASLLGIKDQCQIESEEHQAH